MWDRAALQHVRHRVTGAVVQHHPELLRLGAALQGQLVLADRDVEPGGAGPPGADLAVGEARLERAVDVAAPGERQPDGAAEDDPAAPQDEDDDS